MEILPVQEIPCVDPGMQKQPEEDFISENNKLFHNDLKMKWASKSCLEILHILIEDYPEDFQG